MGGTILRHDEVAREGCMDGGKQEERKVPLQPDSTLMTREKPKPGGWKKEGGEKNTLTRRLGTI